MIVNPFVLDHCPNLFLFEQDDRIHFVRGTKAIEEVYHRQFPGQRAGVGNQGYILRLLYRC